MVFLNSLAIAGASASLICAIVYFRRERKYSKMMDDIDQMKLIEFDSILDLSDLPQNPETFAIRATVDEGCLTRPAKRNQDLDVVYSMFTRSLNPPQMFGSLQDFNFKVSSPQGLEMSIKQSQGTPTILFDLHKVSQEFDQSEIGRAQPQVRKLRNQDKKFIEVGILPNEQYIFVGSLAKTHSESSAIFKPRVIMGDDKIKFLKSLDVFLAENSVKGKKCLGIMVGIAAVHFIASRAFPELFMKQKPHYQNK